MIELSIYPSNLTLLFPASIFLLLLFKTTTKHKQQNTYPSILLMDIFQDLDRSSVSLLHDF